MPVETDEQLSDVLRYLLDNNFPDLRSMNLSVAFRPTASDVDILTDTRGTLARVNRGKARDDIFLIEIDTEDIPLENLDVVKGSIGHELSHLVLLYSNSTYSKLYRTLDIFSRYGSARCLLEKLTDYAMIKRGLKNELRETREYIKSRV